MKRSFVSIGVSLSLAIFHAPGLADPITEAAELASDPPITAVRDCLGKPGGDACLDGLFRQALHQQSPAQVLELIRHYGESDSAVRLSCHPVVHAVGREVFRLKGNLHDAFRACDQTCHSGCYHGAVERFLRGDGTETGPMAHVNEYELMRKTSTACDANTPARIYFQCLHGLGHALMYFTQNELAKSLRGCDTLPDVWSRESCYGGVFMENVFSAAPGKRDVSATDYHYPCNKVGLEYRGACYLMQTWRMEEMGLTTAQLFEKCRQAGAFETQCAQSVGRDLSNVARGGGNRPAAEKCERAQGESRRACIRGVVYALIDHTWDASYALPFWSALGGEDAAYYYKISKDYLGTFAQK